MRERMEYISPKEWGGSGVIPVDVPVSEVWGYLPPLPATSPETQFVVVPPPEGVGWLMPDTFNVPIDPYVPSSAPVVPMPEDYVNNPLLPKSWLPEEEIAVDPVSGFEIRGGSGAGVWGWMGVPIMKYDRLIEVRD